MKTEEQRRATKEQRRATKEQRVVRMHLQNQLMKNIVLFKLVKKRPEKVEQYFKKQIAGLRELLAKQRKELLANQ